MPYIDPHRRTMLANVGHQAETPGELNYKITGLITQYLAHNFRHVGYTQMNEIMGVLECAKQEFYRRVVVPYENTKCEENGDCY